MTEKDNYIHEVYASMTERTIKRFWILCIILVVALVGSNAYWINYSRQFESVTTTTIDATQDGEGPNLVSGGDLNYGSEGEGN